MREVVSMINDPGVDLIDKAKVYLAYIPSRVEIVGKTRSWIGEFVPDFASFSVPSSPSHLWQRLKQNLVSFQMNYGIIATSMIFYSLVVTNPFLLVCVSFGLACSYITFQYAEASVRSYLSYRSVKWTVVIVVLIVLLLILYSIATWISGLAAIIIFGHAITRDEKLVNRDSNIESGEDTNELLNK